ncbi:hypothetical protein Pelo_10102 [Pelomyxa schiedti]|nr:hypothetical protein Pelo_10102 [Pelomyxa schiedti]
MQRTTLETKYQILLSQFEQLKEDFTYNLKLLEGRDAELESYVTSLQQYKEALRDRDVAISDLRVHESQLAERVTRAEGVVSMQRSAQEDILRQLSEQAETQARQIKAQAAKQIEDSTLQWQSEREALEDRIHVMQQEHDMVLNDLRAHADHTAGQLHIANGKIVALSNQIKRLESRVSELQELLKEKERKLKERTWELEDSKQSAAATEFHLSGEREQIQEQWEHLQTEYQAKVSELHIKLDTAQKSLDLLRSEQEIENQKREEHAAEQHKSFQEQSQKQLETFKSQLAGLQTEWREERDNLKQLKWENI